jgi:hypothetical protein
MENISEGSWRPLGPLERVLVTLRKFLAMLKVQRRLEGWPNKREDLLGTVSRCFHELPDEE